ncbi:Myb/SANT-like DNA-binding domain-containing protein [Epithele typhae]|uniref:Myb/SANT-like DNA-binding domain-containing protein n=1 Tax=Epithele typhae TaxID=378194 RepID=UPI002007F5E6|nr:Myb/SANT-like DNA-binding domain-containing protein [Epithele typhae]KAH9916123.1 Myb/SANT-like DNA-binding domain-containing protein [Epithele typhae]
MPADTTPAPPVKVASTRIIWTPEKETLVLQTLLELRLDRDLVAENGFNTTAYVKCAAVLVGHGHAAGKEQVKAKWTRIKGDYNIVKELRSKSGFGWDEETQQVLAEDNVWRGILDPLMTSNPKRYNRMKHWRDNSFPHYDLVSQIVGDTQAVGDNAFSSELGAEVVAQRSPSPLADEDHGEEGNDDENEMTQAPPRPVTPPSDHSEDFA